MERYTEEIERKMLILISTLNEKDRRRYAAIEALKLGHGGIEYISEILQIDAKTIQKGIEDFEKKIY